MIVNNKKVQNDPPQEKIKFILELFNSNKLIETKKEVDKQFTIYSKSSVLLNILGAILAGQNKLREALKSYNKSIQINPNYAQAYNNFAYSLVERNDNLELALEMSIIANRIQPKSAPYLDTLGWIYYKLEQYEKALEYVQKSYSLDNTNPVILEHLADILKATNQISKANLIYMQAIDIGGDSLLIQQKIDIE